MRSSQRFCEDMVLMEELEHNYLQLVRQYLTGTTNRHSCVETKLGHSEELCGHREEHKRFVFNKYLVKRRIVFVRVVKRDNNSTLLYYYVYFRTKQLLTPTKNTSYLRLFAFNKGFLSEVLPSLSKGKGRCVGLIHYG